MAGEQKLQSRIMATLKKSGWIVIRQISLSKNGWPDVYALRSGVAIFIEVKNPNRSNDASPLQDYRIETLRKAGFKAEVIYTYDEFKSLFSENLLHNI